MNSNPFTKIYYKILTSQRFSYIENEFAIKYEVGKIVGGHDTPARFGWGLFVFDTYQHAYSFYGLKGTIWEVQGYDEVSRLPINVGTWPTGTVMVRRIKLIKEIKRR